MKTIMLKNIAIATSIAVLFAALDVAPVRAAGDDVRVKCEDSSSCKGQGPCKTATSYCKAQNACAGHGLTEHETEEACKDAQQFARDLLDQSRKSG